MQVHTLILFKGNDGESHSLTPELFICGDSKVSHLGLELELNPGWVVQKTAKQIELMGIEVEPQPIRFQRESNLPRLP